MNRSGIRPQVVDHQVQESVLGEPTRRNQVGDILQKRMFICGLREGRISTKKSPLSGQGMFVRSWQGMPLVF